MAKPIKMRDLLILGLLRESQMYGYEIKRLIDHVMSHFVDVSSGSLYYGLKRLAELGYVVEAAVEKVGKRPERSVYKITELGIEVLETELPSLLFPESRSFSPFDLGLYFIDFIPPKECTRRLKLRRAFIELVLEYLEEVSGESRLIEACNHAFILSHMTRHCVMERDFVDELLQRFTEYPAYELSAEDKRLVREELDNYKQRLKYETVDSD